MEHNPAMQSIAAVGDEPQTRQRGYFRPVFLSRTKSMNQDSSCLLRRSTLGVARVGAMAPKPFPKAHPRNICEQSWGCLLICAVEAETTRRMAIGSGRLVKTAFMGADYVRAFHGLSRRYELVSGR